MSALLWIGAGVLAVAVLPPYFKRLQIRRKHKMFYYLEYVLHGDKYDTMENGPINEYLADALIHKLQSEGGRISYQYNRQNIELVQDIIDSRYDESRLDKLAIDSAKKQ